MPTPLEYVIRPFQAPEGIQEKSIIVTTVVKQARQKAIISWGAAGQQPTPYSTGLSFKVKDPFEFEEYERFSTDVRIENPDDKNQFVVAARPDQISFRKTKDPTEETVSTTTNQSGASGGASSTTASNTGEGEASVSEVTTETTLTTTTTKKDAYTYKLKKPAA